MAIIKKYSPYQNLSSFQTFLMDTNPNSDYFRITEFKDTFTGGKNGFLIEGSEFLKETTEVKVEILDVEGNPVYFEPGDGNPEYYEGLSKLVSVHVYDDTPIGIGKITILGELKNYINESGASVPVPDEWKGIYNVKWEKSFKINKNLNNEDVVRFYKRPIVNITEIVKPIFNKTIPTKTISGSVSGIPQQPSQGSDLSTWSAGTLYKLVKSSGSWDVDIDENPITVSVDGNTYTPTIIEVLNEREVLVDVPYTSNNIVQSFTSQSFTASFQDIENEVVGESSLTGSFAKIDMYQLKTFVGDVARVKIFRRSKNQVNDFQLVQESKLESTELLRDVYTTSSVEIPYGQFSTDVLTNYWETSSNDHTTSVNSAILNQAVKVDYDNGIGGIQTLKTQESFTLSKDVEYTLSFRTLLSGSSDSEKYVKAYFSGSYTNSLGNPTSYTQSFMHISGSDIYKTRQSVSQNILAERDIDAKLVFEFKGDDWYVSNVSLRNAQETSFSPDEFTLIQDIPRKLETETFDFRFEFYDINNNYIPVDVTATKEFDGGNDYVIGGTSARILTFDSNKESFRYISGSASPAGQLINFSLSKTNLTGSITYTSQAFDETGSIIQESGWERYPGFLTTKTETTDNASSVITVSNFEGSWTGSTEKPKVFSLTYTASVEDLYQYESVFRVEDGENAPTLIVSPDDKFTYEPTILSPKPLNQSVSIRAQRKNLESSTSLIKIFANSSLGREQLSGSSQLTSLGHPDISGSIVTDPITGVSTYTLTALQFSQSFASNSIDEIKYEFTGSDIFGNEQSDEYIITKIINFDGVSIVLSNESTSFPANSTGEVTGGFVASSGSVQMYIGGTSISHNDGLSTPNRFDITSISGTNVTPTSISPTNSNYSISAFDTNKDSGSLTLSIDYLAGDNSTTQTFQKVVSYTKAKKGVPTVLTKTSPTTQTINSSSAGFETPQTIDVILQEGGDEYTYLDPPLSPNTFRINSLGYTQGSASFSNEVITLFPSSSLGGIITTGIIGSASIDYRDSEGTSYTNKLVRFDLSVSKIGVDGQNGASGSDAKVVSLNSTAYAIKYDGDGNLSPSGQTFTLSGSVQNFISPEFQFLEDGLVIQSWGSDSDVIVPTDAGTLPSGGQTSLYEVQVRENGGSYAGVFDNIDVFGVQSGSDAFTTFLTNEAHVFAADSTGTVTSVISDGAFETRFFRGAQQYTYDGTSPYDINSYRVANVSATGITISQSTVGSQRKFTPTAISANSGSVTLDLVDNNTGQSFEKTYTFSISKKAEPSITFTSTPQAQSVNATSTGTLNDSIVDVVISGFEGNTALSYNQTATLGVGEYKITNVAGVTVADTTPSTSTIDITAFSGNTATGTASISYKDSEGNTGTDTIKFTLSKSKNATPTVSILASPQAQTVESDSSYSSVGTPSNVTLIVNEGGSNYTYTTGTVTANKFRITSVTNATNNNNGTITPNTPTDSSGTSGVITYSYTNSEGTAFTGKTINFSVGVAVQGANGLPGDPGNRVSSGLVYYQVSATSAPATPSATSYTFSTNTFSGLTSNWAFGAPTFEAANSKKYWYSTYTVTETTSEGDNGVPSFSTPTQAIGFTGLVTFTSTNKITDGSNILENVPSGSITNHIGGPNVTTIDGGKISTGLITSTGYATTNPDDGEYTTAGTIFNLDNGSLRSKNFYIDSSGNAYFKGNIEVGSTVPSSTVSGLGDLATQDLTDLGALAALDDITLAKVTDAGSLAALNSVGSSQIDSNAVTAAKIISNAVTEAKIATNAITEGKISANAVVADKIAANAIVSDKIAANAVIAAKISAGAISADKIAANAVTADKILANTITAAKISSLSFSGKTAVFDTGTIGGFTLKSSALYTETKSTLASTAAGVYIGTDGIALGTNSPFKVTSAGVLSASGATISGELSAGLVDIASNNITLGNDGSWGTVSRVAFEDGNNDIFCQLYAYSSTYGSGLQIGGDTAELDNIRISAQNIFFQPEDNSAFTSLEGMLGNTYVNRFKNVGWYGTESIQLNLGAVGSGADSFIHMIRNASIPYHTINMTSAGYINLSSNGSISINTGSTSNYVFVTGILSKSGGSFQIDHPLPEMKDTHYLVHSFVESPQANNIYRGRVTLENGTATINLDTESNMTEGTWVRLNRDPHVYTSNETDWDNVRGSVDGNILTIECQNPTSTATVTWMVLGERHDDWMMETTMTDEDGRVIVEIEKTEANRPKSNEEIRAEYEQYK